MPHSRKSMVPVVFAAGFVILFAGCGGGGGSSPTAPANRTLMLSSASILVDGQPVPSGGTFHHGRGAATRFEARLTDQGHPAPGYRVEIQFQRPGGMMHHAGAFFLYDDGTHGDPTPGDGVYCFEDADGDYGFHHMGAFRGEYHYDFCGLYPDGAETNHRVVDITVDD